MFDIGLIIDSRELVETERLHRGLIIEGIWVCVCVLGGGGGNGRYIT